MNTFNIETYLDSLSEYTKVIDVSRKGITYLPDLSRFKKLKELYCHFNYLTSLPPLEKLQILICDNNQLTSLPELNENLQKLFCSNNQLTSLPPLNEKLEVLFCHTNQLTSLPELNEQLDYLDCYNNQLTSLHLNKQLNVLHCYNNQLYSLHLNEKLKYLSCYNNPISEIIGVKDTIKKLKILNNFCYLYYCLKFKKRFRDLLWIKIREPKIREKYSHDNLVKHLHDDTDLDELLDSW